MVMPRSRSALSLSRTQAYLKEPLPNSAASFSNFSMANPDRQPGGWERRHGQRALTSTIDPTALRGTIRERGRSQSSRTSRQLTL